MNEWTWAATVVLGGPILFGLGHWHGVATERIKLCALYLTFGHLPERMRDELADLLRGKRP